MGKIITFSGNVKIVEKEKDEQNSGGVKMKFIKLIKIYSIFGEFVVTYIIKNTVTGVTKIQIFTLPDPKHAYAYMKKYYWISKIRLCSIHGF